MIQQFPQRILPICIFKSWWSTSPIESHHGHWTARMQLACRRHSYTLPLWVVGVLEDLPRC